MTDRSGAATKIIYNGMTQADVFRYCGEPTSKSTEHRDVRSDKNRVLSTAEIDRWTYESYGATQVWYFWITSCSRYSDCDDDRLACSSMTQSKTAPAISSSAVTSRPPTSNPLANHTACDPHMGATHGHDIPVERDRPVRRGRALGRGSSGRDGGPSRLPVDELRRFAHGGDDFCPRCRDEIDALHEMYARTPRRRRG